MDRCTSSAFNLLPKISVAPSEYNKTTKTQFFCYVTRAKYNYYVRKNTVCKCDNALLDKSAHAQFGINAQSSEIKREGKTCFRLIVSNYCFPT